MNFDVKGGLTSGLQALKVGRVAQNEEIFERCISLGGLVFLLGQ